MSTKREKREDAGIRVEVDEKIFPRPVTIAAAYVFIDRCYLRLARGERGRLVVHLKGKEPLASKAQTALAAEFENELLHQLMRQQVSGATAGLREVLVGRALLSAEPSTSSPGEAPEGEDQDYLDDPLGIAVPWEEKYGAENKDTEKTDSTEGSTDGKGQDGGEGDEGAG